MSAFLCSDLQTAIVARAYASRLGGALPTQDIAPALRELNAAALLACHPQDDPCPPLAWSWTLERDAVQWMATHTLADIARAVACFRYQCAEGDCEALAWYRTLARFADSLEKLVGPAAWEASSVWSVDSLEDAPAPTLRRRAA